jgi:hypothetical protein
MDDVERIAAGLRAAERDALAGLYSWSSPQDEEDGEIALVEAGLWNELYGCRGSRLTPLGLRVIRYMKRENAK